MIDVFFASVYVSIRLVQLLQDGVNFNWFHLLGWFLLKLLGGLHFDVAVDSGSLVGLIIGAFRCIFSHGDGVFV